MLYASRECARVALEEGLEARFARHRECKAEMVRGVEALGLKLYGHPATRMTNVTGIYVPAHLDEETVRTRMRDEHGIEISTAFGPLAGKIWRIGAMGHNAHLSNVRRVLAALETCLK